MVNHSPEVVEVGGSGDVVPHQNVVSDEQFDAESSSEAEKRGPDDAWKFWQEQIVAALINERRWRTEALECERLYFGADNDPGANTSDNASDNKIDDKTALIHANIDVEKPLLFSETPQPVVRRRFRGDGKMDETDLMAAEAGQRLSQYMLDTEPFDEAMENARDDWLIAGRGSCRVIYRAEFVDREIIHPMTGQPVMVKAKRTERVTPRYVAWRRLILAPSTSWHVMPWKAIETPMTRTAMIARFGQEKVDRVNFNHKGLVGQSHGVREEDRDIDQNMVDDTETGEKTPSPFDTCLVHEIWNKETGEVIWWSAGYTEGLLDKDENPLDLEDFWPMPQPLMSTTKGEQMNPRPSIKYYERRADEVNLASKKLKSILDVVSVSGMFPGQMAEQVKKLLSGDNEMIPVESWIKLMEKGGTANIIQWLPLQHMVAAIQALVTLREQSKQAMFEASGVSDIMRAQGDPNETATAQQMKGRYAGLRLSDRQRKIAHYARDLLRLMVEIGLEHFDTATIAEMTGLDLPMTEQERAQIIAQQQAEVAQYQQMMQIWQMVAQAIEAGQMPGPVPPQPEEPKHDRVPETSWELVHERLRTDYGRKISVTIETQSTVLADEQADKEARIEFLSAFSKFVNELAPLAGTGHFDYKTIKELLMFGIRGFPQSRTLESLIGSLPDEPEGEPPEDTQVTVANIKAEVDLEIEKMRQANNEADRQAEQKLKGADLLQEAARIQAEPAQQPTAQGA